MQHWAEPVECRGYPGTLARYCSLEPHLAMLRRTRWNQGHLCACSPGTDFFLAVVFCWFGLVWEPQLSVLRRLYTWQCSGDSVYIVQCWGHCAWQCTRETLCLAVLRSTSTRDGSCTSCKENLHSLCITCTRFILHKEYVKGWLCNSSHNYRSRKDYTTT